MEVAACRFPSGVLARIVDQDHSIGFSSSPQGGGLKRVEWLSEEAL